MLCVLVVAEEDERAKELYERLARAGFECLTASEADDPAYSGKPPDFIFVETRGSSEHSREMLRRLKSERQVPIIALMDKEKLESLDKEPSLIDDFVIKPLDVIELSLRARRLLPGIRKDRTSSELITAGDLVVDLAACEVTVGGRLVPLTFKEYELLKLLVSNKGRVFTRDALLNKVWGYDYFGGDRTVDVHIRRLRSKIEDANHSFVETVRNIGYRFRNDI